jgi:O-antigen/teichoic acid export membrane protein
MNNRVGSDKPKEKEYISKATIKKLLRLGLIFIGIAALYFICRYIDQYIGNLVLK